MSCREAGITFPYREDARDLKLNIYHVTYLLYIENRNGGFLKKLKPSKYPKIAAQIRTFFQILAGYSRSLKSQKFLICLSYIQQ